MNVSLNDATRAQIDAARPDASTWLTANAGSGKTRVLTDRVARLLLGGTDPQQILCLTYTKAAASEMQNRLFNRLGTWSMLDDAALSYALRQLGVESDPNPEYLRNARTLFARAIETPGGLKIQTIHSFCAGILRRFPLEAGVSPQFAEIEDRAAELLRAEIVEEMAGGSDAPLVSAVAQHYTGEDFSKITRSIVGMRDAFGGALDRADFLSVLGHPPDLCPEMIERAAFIGGEVELIAGILPPMLEKGGNDGKAAICLQDFDRADISALPLLESVFLTGSGAKEPFAAKIGSFPTKPTQAIIGAALPELEDFMQRVEETREPRLALLAAERSLALHAFSQAFLMRYESAKQLRGWLDFDDLILKTRSLLSDPQVAAWVLYRIDGGIDHVLVDEAQDTSPRQWDVIELLTEEFYSGTGARDEVERTVFVVGDKKQSIYSFQGADPEEMDRKARHFEERIRAAQQPFQQRSLAYSFRSASAILRLVDQAFDPSVQQGLDRETLHRAFKSNLPGRVDLWPAVEKADDKDDRDWTDPVDRRSEQHHAVVLADRIATRIRELTDGTHYIPDDGAAPGTVVRRRIRPGDFLILVQGRGELFAEIIRACKAAGLPIAGADRLKVGAELAVRDLGALLSFLATPDDSLSLATALKSPLFGWNEQALYTLARRPAGSTLWQALRRQEQTHPDTLNVLKDLRGQVDFLRPYDLVERIITRHGGRARLLGRLGPEAEDGINAMLTQALAYERTAVPSLTGFLEWMQTDDLEIKRQIDNSSDQIRVMSVHGAKGLEAPIVILPDCAMRKNEVKDTIIRINNVPVWKSPAGQMPNGMQARVDDMKSAQFRERLRLLYVAMTRAEKWLIVAAAGNLSNDSSDWYQIVKTAMSNIDAVPTEDGDTLRFEEGDWDGLPLAEAAEKTTDIPELEPVFTQPAPPWIPTKEILSPSDLGGPKALPGEAGLETEAALAYGALVHGLLEHIAGLDPDEARQVAARIGAQHPPEVVDQALEEALRTVSNASLTQVFSPDALTEVSVTAPIGNLRLHGAIDRLIITDERILAVDFKTNRVVPASVAECPLGLLRQMGAYAHMLGQIYPSHRIETAFLWTATGALMVLPHDTVSNALWSSPHLDGARDAS